MSMASPGIEIWIFRTTGKATFPGLASPKLSTTFAVIRRYEPYVRTCLNNEPSLGSQRC
jgi:hypothetical protein